MNSLISKLALQPKSLILFACLAHIPMALEYTLRMWRTGHYQFFPLVILVIGWLWFQMHDKLTELAEAPNSKIFTAAMSLVIGLVTLATFLNSSFVGAVSMSVLFATALYGLYGQPAFLRALPLVFLTMFIIPLPGRLDSWLIFNLQFIASQLASWVLDVFQQTHFLEGVVLQTETRGFLTEEACSGVRSLFSSLAGIAIYGVTMRYRLPRQLFNLLQTVGWVVVGNAFRVAIVVYISEHFSDRIASGRPHELLGLFVFVMIFLLAISTDRLFGAFASKPLEDDEFSEVDEEFEVRQREKTPAQSEPVGWLPYLVIPVSLLVFLLGARLTYLQTLNHQGLAAYTYDRLPFPDETDLPAQIGGWQRVKFEHTNRGKENLQAEDSFVWTFENQGLRALVSVDCPWDVWHNLDDCYTGLGWNTSIRHFYKGRDVMELDSEFVNDEFSQIGMNKRGGETGVVIFSSMDAKAQQVLPQFSSGFFSVKSVYQQIAGNIATTLGLTGQEKAALKGYRLPLSTVQLYCTPQMEVTPDQIHELRGLFVEARKRLKQSQRFQTNSNPKLRLASKPNTDQ